MIPRRSRTVPATIVALVILAAGVTVAIDVVSVKLGRPALIWPYQQMATQLRANHYDDPAILAVSAATAVLGVLLLLAAAIPGRRGLILLASGDTQVITAADRRGMRRALREAAMGVDGIDRAKVKLGRNTVKVTGRSPLRDPSRLTEQVQTAVTQRMNDLQPARPRRATTKVRSDKE